MPFPTREENFCEVAKPERRSIRPLGYCICRLMIYGVNEGIEVLKPFELTLSVE